MSTTSWPSRSSSALAASYAAMHSGCTSVWPTTGVRNRAIRSRPGSRRACSAKVSPAGSGGAQCGSPGSGPAMMSSSAAASATVQAIGPITPSPGPTSPPSGPLLTRPRLGLSPNRPQLLAGIRIEPPPSLPCAIGASPPATAAAAPPLDPPAPRDRSHGVRAGGPISVSV